MADNEQLTQDNSNFRAEFTKKIREIIREANENIDSFIKNDLQNIYDKMEHLEKEMIKQRNLKKLFQLKKEYKEVIEEKEQKEKQLDIKRKKEDQLSDLLVNLNKYDTPQKIIDRIKEIDALENQFINQSTNQSFFQKYKIQIIIIIAIVSIIIIVVTIVLSVTLPNKNKNEQINKPGSEPISEPVVTQLDDQQYNQYEDPQYKEHYEELEDDTKSDKKKSIKKSIKIPKDKITSFFTQKHNSQYYKEQNIDKQYEPVKEETIKDNNTHVSTLTDNSCHDAPCLCSETNVYLNSYINNSF